MEFYAGKVDVDIKFVPAFFLLYLMEVTCFHLDMFHRDGIRNEQREWLQKNWAEMLDELINHWEEHWNQWQ